LNEIVKANDESIFTDEQIKIIRDTVAQGATPIELQFFLHQCNRTKLDPLLNQIHFIKRKSWDAATGGYIEKPTIQAGIDGLRLIADRTGKYAPGDPPEYKYDKNGRLYSARVSILKLVKDQWFRVWGEAFFSEYVATNKSGEPVAMWKSKPHIMLSKCAEAAALRKGFPAELSGVYSHDELEQADGPTRLPEIEQAAPAPEPIAQQGPDLALVQQLQTELYTTLTGSGVEQASAIAAVNACGNNIDMLNAQIDEAKIQGGRK